MPEQRRILFTGHVQGVGFRYTTHRLAGGHEVAGFVRNLDNGQVELVVEGEPAEIDALLAEIRDHFGANIRSEAIDKSPVSGLHTGFKILR